MGIERNKAEGLKVKALHNPIYICILFFFGKNGG